MKYLTVTETHPAALDEAVNKRLAIGWELYGQPFHVESGDTWCQTMIKPAPKGALGRITAEAKES